MSSHGSVNKVMLIGRLGKDPELRYTSAGRPRCSMSVATSYRYKDKDKDNWIEKTQWHQVIAWGKTGEVCKQYLTKGRRIFIEGRLESRAYTDKEGQQKHAHEVVTDSIVFLEGRKDGSMEPAASDLAPATTAAAEGDDQDLPF